jgi:glycolate oxidase FAD binding subunit
MRDTTNILEPSTLAEAAALMHEHASAGTRLAFVGGGTHMIGEPESGDALLSTRRLSRIVEYAPEDQTVTVEAGVTVAKLAEVLARCGQRLVLDVADPQRSTIGGAIASNAYGPRRLRFGSLKDLILGVSLVRADGVAARAGGKVVKNVAGFDISKFVVGSHGTLALITSATLRVHPLPQVSQAIRVAQLSAELVWELILAMREQQLEPTAIIAVRRMNGLACYDVDIVFEGVRSGVDAQVDCVHALADIRRLSIAELASEQAFAADAEIRSAGPLRVRCTTSPSGFAASEEHLIEPLARTLTSPVVNAYPAFGIFTVAGTPTPGTAAVLATCRERIERRGGSLIVEVQPPATGGVPVIEPWGTPPPSFGLMQQLKSRFDPNRRLAPGHFVGGL